MDIVSRDADLVIKKNTIDKRVANGLAQLRAGSARTLTEDDIEANQPLLKEAGGNITFVKVFDVDPNAKKKPPAKKKAAPKTAEEQKAQEEAQLRESWSLLVAEIKLAYKGIRQRHAPKFARSRYWLNLLAITLLLTETGLEVTVLYQLLVGASWLWAAGVALLLAVQFVAAFGAALAYVDRTTAPGTTATFLLLGFPLAPLLLDLCVATEYLGLLALCRPGAKRTERAPVLRWLHAAVPAYHAARAFTQTLLGGVPMIALALYVLVSGGATADDSTGEGAGARGGGAGDGGAPPPWAAPTFLEADLMRYVLLASLTHLAFTWSRAGLAACIAGRTLSAQVGLQLHLGRGLPMALIEANFLNRLELVPGARLRADETSAFATALETNTSLEAIHIARESFDDLDRALAACGDALVHNKVSNLQAFSWDGLELSKDTSAVEFRGKTLMIRNAPGEVMLGMRPMALQPGEAKMIGGWLAKSSSITRLTIVGDDDTDMKPCCGRIGDDAAATLGASLPDHPSLLQLTLSKCGLGDAGIIALGRGLAENGGRYPGVGLQSLDLSGNTAISDKGIFGFAACLTAWPETNQLIWELENQTNIGFTTPHHHILGQDVWRRNATLTELRLAECSITAAGVGVLAEGIKTNTALQSVDLAGNRDLGDAGAEALTTLFTYTHEPFLPGTTTLKRVVLRSCGVGEEGGKALARSLASNASLTEIDLADNPGMADEAAQALGEALAGHPPTRVAAAVGAADGAAQTSSATTASAATLGGHPTLTKLDLGYCSVGAVGAAALATGLASNTALTELVLTNNTAIGDAGTRALCASLTRSNTTLTALDLGQCAVGVDGGNALADLLAASPSAACALKKLDISYNSEITGAAKEALQSAAAALKDGGLVLCWLDSMKVVPEPPGNRQHTIPPKPAAKGGKEGAAKVDGQADTPKAEGGAEKKMKAEAEAAAPVPPAVKLPPPPPAPAPSPPPAPSASAPTVAPAPAAPVNVKKMAAALGDVSA